MESLPLAVHLLICVDEPTKASELISPLLWVDQDIGQWLFAEEKSTDLLLTRLTTVEFSLSFWKEAHRQPYSHSLPAFAFFSQIFWGSRSRSLRRNYHQHGEQHFLADPAADPLLLM